MLDIARVAPIGEASGEPANQRQAAVDLSQQQRTSVRCDVAAVETSHHSPPFDYFKFEQLRSTLCRHRGVPRIGKKSFSQNNFR